MNFHIAVNGIAGFAGIASALLHPPEAPLATVQMLLRWIHLLAGITWIGLLYFFNLVNVPFMRELDPAVRGKIMPALMMRALWWFRWSAMITVLAGISYWMITISHDVHSARALASSAPNAADSQMMANASFGPLMASFWGIWIAVFAIEYALVMVAKIDSGALLAVLMTALVTGASWLFLSLNAHGWESNQLLSIGVGGGIGLTMLLAVWGIIWRLQKKLIAWTSESAASGNPPPPQAATFARQAFLISRINAWLTIPMLFLMAAASHYPMFGK